MRAEQLVKTCLSVVIYMWSAPYVDYQYCYEASKTGLARGNELVSFTCSKCEAICCDPVELTRKL